MSSLRSDFELLDTWRHGDRDAGEQLFERHFGSVLGYFERRAGPDAKDLAQRTFLACVEHREHIRGEASFRTFLFAVAHNVLLKHLRSKQCRDDRIDGGVSGILDVSPSTSMMMAVNEEYGELRAALSRLGPEHRGLLELYYWERRTSAEIAKALGVPHGTVRTRIRRARGLLREELEHTGRRDRAASRASTQSLGCARRPSFSE